MDDINFKIISRSLFTFFEREYIQVFVFSHGVIRKDFFLKFFCNSESGFSRRKQNLVQILCWLKSAISLGYSDRRTH